ncbi:putative lipoprotein [Photobacterium damselae subsp. damselae CIP 102761]|uniref:Putative lipoprotein n=1 Tax=Photobacterium damselae subsp. damselae CIP 102761 TaxID=675817 RepID=D0YYK1_PHODD|nr:putative lipoprotein [Photobacterium damselae subsp. damselae CIP 102761]
MGYKVLSVIEVENTDLAGKYELEGTLSQLDSVASTFKLGQVVVDYANIQLDPTIGNGDWVEVTGEMIDGAFVATEVEVDNYDDNEDFDDAEIEGVVTWINNEKTLFTLNARGQFVINNSTRFEDGTRNNLKMGTLVEVTAINGVAKEIEFERDHDGDHDQGTWREFDVEGIVSDVTDSTITLYGVQQPVYVDNMTRYEDRLTLATLPGKRVEIEGIVRNGQKIAREIELEELDD